MYIFSIVPFQERTTHSIGSENASIEGYGFSEGDLAAAIVEIRANFTKVKANTP